LYLKKQPNCITPTNHAPAAILPSCPRSIERFSPYLIH